MKIEKFKDSMIQKFKHAKTQRLMRSFASLRMTIQCVLLAVAVYSFVSASDANANKYNWGALRNGTAGIDGTNGTVYAMTDYQGSIIVAGGFTQAGGINVTRNIAQWSFANGWEGLGQGTGFNDTVYALFIQGGFLYAAGRFTQVDGINASRLAVWDGNSWSSLGANSNLSSEVRAITFYNNQLVAGGKFILASGSPIKHLARWNGSVWLPFGSPPNDGVNNDVFALIVPSDGFIPDTLYVGGSFDTAGVIQTNHIARWDATQWASLGIGTSDWVHAFAIHNGQIIVGGKFIQAGGNNVNYIANWNGTTWSAFGAGMTDAVFSLASYNTELVAGGVFRNAGGHYVDRIAKWNGTDWARMITGTNSRVNALFVHDTSLFAGGSFTTAGGKYISHISEWSNQPTVTVSGVIRYLDNGQPVPPGSKVRALRLDVNTREIIVVDSIRTDSTGHYQLDRVLRDSNTYILSFPEDAFLNALAQDFVPTYYPSSIDWVNAVRIYPIVPLTNINVNVLRVTPEPQNPLVADLGGHVYLRFTPPEPGSDAMDVGLPYKSGAIVYAKQGDYYRKFAVSNTLEEYTLTQLAPGTYDLYVNRIGYTSATRTIPFGTVSIDTVDFYLDTLNPIGIHNINTEVPERFVLEQNYPNPFNPSTVISFQLPVAGKIKLTIYDLLGREVATLVNEELRAGTYEVVWNAEELASGLYFYQLQAGDYAETKKMVLLK